MTLLAAVEQQRADCLALGRRRLRRGDTTAAAEQAERAHALRGDADSARLAALAHLLGRRFRQAFDWHARSRCQAP